MRRNNVRDVDMSVTWSRVKSDPHERAIVEETLGEDLIDAYMFARGNGAGLDGAKEAVPVLEIHRRLGHDWQGVGAYIVLEEMYKEKTARF
tara:strand:+ start:146 stop:418 length:273 start_codon:yes stop_codon:yes gene_type:complete